MALDIQPERFDFSLWRGTTYRRRFTLLQGGAGSDPYDLGSHTARLAIRDSTGGDVLLDLTTENDGIATDSDGNIDVVITDETTTDIEWSGGVYDLLLTAPGGDTFALLWGTVKVRGG